MAAHCVLSGRDQVKWCGRGQRIKRNRGLNNQLVATFHCSSFSFCSTEVLVKITTLPLWQFTADYSIDYKVVDRVTDRWRWRCVELRSFTLRENVVVQRILWCNRTNQLSLFVVLTSNLVDLTSIQEEVHHFYLFAFSPAVIVNLEKKNCLIESVGHIITSSFKEMLQCIFVSENSEKNVFLTFAVCHGRSLDAVQQPGK